MHIRTFSKFKLDKAVEGVSKHLMIIEKISQEESEKISRRAFGKYLDRSEKRWNNENESGQFSKSRQ